MGRNPHTYTFIFLLAVVALGGCQQTEGEVCEVRSLSTESDCQEDLVCCRGPTAVRGVCLPAAECNATLPDAGGAGTDAGPFDGGPDGGPESDAGTDAGTDGGPADAGQDAGQDAGRDSGPPDGGSDAAVDGGVDAGSST